VEEAKRLIYVAATRAEDRLVLLSEQTGEIADGRLAEAQPILDPNQAPLRVYDSCLKVSVIPSPERIVRASGTEQKV